jgi:predicted transcriptional regulator of viral defense system
VAAVAALQGGVVSLLQLRALGMSASGVRTWVARGRLHRGVYAVGHPIVGNAGRSWAAILACGPGAVLSHRSAADLLGLRPSSRRKIDVTVPGPGRRHREIDVHCSRTHPDEVTTCDGIPCTTVARTLLDLADVLPRREVERALERAEMLRTFDLKELEAVLARGDGRRGVPVLRAILADYDEPALTRNELEEAFLAICAEAGVPMPKVNLWIPLEDGRGYEADFAWPEQHLIVETDGHEAHGTRRAFQYDRRRDRELLVSEWRVIRFTWREVMREPRMVSRTLVALLT